MLAIHNMWIKRYIFILFRTRNPFQFQWLHNGMVIKEEREGVMESFLKIRADARNVAGNYSCRVVSGSETILDLFVGTLSVYGMYEHLLYISE